MRKKLLLLTAALALAAGASAARPAAANQCFTTCCDNEPSLCYTCCLYGHCLNFACPD